MYLRGYTNQPDFFKKLHLPEEGLARGSHKIELKFQLFSDDNCEDCLTSSRYGPYNDDDIGVTIDDHVQLDTGCGIGMKGRGKGRVILAATHPGFSRQLEVLFDSRGPVRIWNESARGSFL